jgi:hypothetical protein
LELIGAGTVHPADPRRGIDRDTHRDDGAEVGETEAVDGFFGGSALVVNLDAAARRRRARDGLGNKKESVDWVVCNESSRIELAAAVGQ